MSLPIYAESLQFYKSLTKVKDSHLKILIVPARVMPMRIAVAQALTNILREG